MKTRYVLPLALMIVNNGYSQSEISSTTYQQILKLQDSVMLFHGKLKLINVYKQQLKAIYESQDKPEAAVRASIIQKTFSPYQSLWTSYVGDSTVYYEKVMRPLIQNNMALLDQKGADFASADLDDFFTSTASKMKKLSGRSARGVWYIAFGSGVADLGGFGNSKMVLDLAHEKTSIDYVKLILPHEINHQIYDLSAPVDTTARGLYRCINEGFAVYMNQKLLGDQYPLTAYLQYTDQELKFCQDNESLIFTKLNRFFLTNDPDHAVAFADRDTKIFRNGPGAIGYYIGYRICESYVEIHGPNSWKDIYTLPVRDVFKGSQYSGGK